MFKNQIWIIGLITLLNFFAPACASEDIYTAYFTAGGPRCGNNYCREGDLCKNPKDNNYTGVCKIVRH